MIHIASLSIFFGECGASDWQQMFAGPPIGPGPAKRAAFPVAEVFFDAESPWSLSSGIFRKDYQLLASLFIRLLLSAATQGVDTGLVCDYDSTHGQYHGG
jgi:hypothetical protein